ncbi:hypothetical protein CASFOL_021938 [Castilleja foliolosa]|uniref:Uncharacterized protein n=1 Tax=Castilleja foliolosa TaxID=1961234 RepID=A0ABD3D0Q2_9LAMI
METIPSTHTQTPCSPSSLPRGSSASIPSINRPDRQRSGPVYGVPGERLCGPVGASGSLTLIRGGCGFRLRATKGVAGRRHTREIEDWRGWLTAIWVNGFDPIGAVKIGDDVVSDLDDDRTGWLRTIAPDLVPGERFPACALVDADTGSDEVYAQVSLIQDQQIFEFGCHLISNQEFVNATLVIFEAHGGELGWCYRIAGFLDFLHKRRNMRFWN